MADFLEGMGRSSQERATAALSRRSRAAWRDAARSLPAPPRLQLDSFSLIAEVKMRAPSAGVLAAPDDPADLAAERACTYAAAGASAISVLTEPERFDGDLTHLAAAASAVDVPCMRKDFVVDPVQVYEGRLSGAGGVLLIAAMLDDSKLQACLDAARELQMFVLLECFDAADLARAQVFVDKGSDPRAPLLVGVNTRNLRTLEVDPNRLATLAPLLPRNAVCVAESGLRLPADAARSAALGYRAALVGSALMQSADPGALAHALRKAGSMPRHGVPKVKICGLTSVEAVERTLAAGADAIGLVLARSPRQITASQARELLKPIPPHIARVAVLREATPALIDTIAGLDFDVVQSAASHPPALPPHLAWLPTVGDAPDAPEQVAALQRVGAPSWRNAVVVDGPGGGGLGLTADWTLAAAASRLSPLVLAGGLRPDTVVDAIRRVRPWGVDVSSGVESSPGVKDPARVAAFVAAVRSVESQ